MLTGLEPAVSTAFTPRQFQSSPVRSTEGEGETRASSLGEVAAALSGSSGGSTLLSRQSLERLLEEQTLQDSPEGSDTPAPAKQSDAGGEEASTSDPDDLSDDEEQVVQKLEKRDAEVRAHEQAHKAAGGPLAGPPSYEYQRGPDGRNYAVSGEVKIDVTPESDPEATIRKMEVVKRAALAPAEPSPQDRQVAAQADAVKAQAEQEASQKREEEEAEKNGEEVSPIKQSIDQAINRAIAAYTATDPGASAKPANDGGDGSGEEEVTVVSPETLVSVTAAASVSVIA